MSWLHPLPWKAELGERGMVRVLDAADHLVIETDYDTAREIGNGVTIAEEERAQWDKCLMCEGGEHQILCEHYGDPDGCNSPLHGLHPYAARIAGHVGGGAR